MIEGFKFFKILLFFTFCLLRWDKITLLGKNFSSTPSSLLLDRIMDCEQIT